MALAIDGSTPAVVVNTSATTATITTASFTPPAGSVLLILWVCDEATTPSTPTITDNLGGHLTYLLGDWKRKADAAPNVSGQAAFWTAPVASSAAMTVTVTTGAASGERVSSLTVQVLTGADTVTPVGAHGKSGSTSAASIAQAYTAAASGGQGFIAVCDPGTTGPETGGAGTTVIGSGTILSNISYAFARRSTADDSNGASNTLNLTLGSTSTDLAWVYAEIMPAAAGGSATWLPTPPVRHRLSIRPFRAHISTPARAQVNPPFPVGAVVDPPRRLRGLLARRPRIVMPVPAQVAVAAPAYPPVPERPRLKGLRLFRPRLAGPVPAQVVFVAAAYPPQSVRTRLKGLRLFRSHAAAPVPAQSVVPPAPYVPTAVRGRLKLPALRRHDNVQPLIEQPGPPQLDPRPRPKFRAIRGRVVQPPAPQPAPAVPLLTRVKLRLVKAVRSRARPVVPPQVILIAPPRVAQATRARRNQFAARRHRGGVEGWMVPGTHICVITRPNTGVVTDPDGLVVRPATGIVINEC